MLARPPSQCRQMLGTVGEVEKEMTARLPCGLPVADPYEAGRRGYPGLIELEVGLLSAPASGRSPAPRSRSGRSRPHHPHGRRGGERD